MSNKNVKSIFQESNHGEARFLLFDDQKVRSLGGWEDVKKECLKSLYQPVLLLYELQDSSPSPVCKSNPQPSVPSRHRSNGVQETKESGTRNVCCSSSSSSSSSSSTTRNRASNVDTTPSISALHAAAKRHHAPDVTTSSSRLASSSGKHHVPPLMVIKSFEKRHITSYVTLEYERSHKKKLLGFRHDMDASGRLVIIGFHPHPHTCLPSIFVSYLSLVFHSFLVVESTVYLMSTVSQWTVILI